MKNEALHVILKLIVLCRNETSESEFGFMHELGVLCHAVKTVSDIAVKNGIKHIKHMTLEVGNESSFVPVFFEKLFPAAIENFPLLKGAKLKLVTAPGKGLVIKEIGY